MVRKSKTPGGEKSNTQFKESLAQKKKRALEIHTALSKLFPSPKCALHFNQDHELLFAVIMSAQCTDKRVNIVTESLYKKYTSLDDFANVSQEELEEDIRSTGFYRNKAKNIRATAHMLLTEFNGIIPDTMEQLLTLKGVARKTANVVLGELYNKAEGVTVDTHVKRLSFRMGLSSEKNPDKVEKDLIKLLPKKIWINFSHELILHGRETCDARKPLCSQCILKDLCPRIGLL